QMPWKGHLSDLPRLRLGLVPRSAHVGGAALNEQLPTVDVDEPSPQRDGLAPAQAHESKGQEENAVPLVAALIGDGTHLRPREVATVGAALALRLPRQFESRGRIDAYAFILDRHRECPAENFGSAE